MSKLRSKNKVFRITRQRAVAVCALAGALLALAGCGKQAFTVAESTSAQSAPGTYIIPPKVDILLAEDNSGSMNQVFTPVSTQMPALLSSLEAKGWDYHFAVVPLSSFRPISQVVASKYDPNWGSAWVAPFPGAMADNLPGTVPSSAFRGFDNFTGFIRTNDLQQDGTEYGFYNIYWALNYDKNYYKRFLRDDALLAVIVVSNGDDQSGLSYYDRGDGVMVATQASKDSSLAQYKSSFLSFKQSASQLKFYSAVSFMNYNSCFGSHAFVGERYKAMATNLGGAAFDICSQSVDSVLDSVASNLEVQKLAFRTHYLFIDQEPDVSTIKVVKYVGGNAGAAVTIPQDATNGWTYAGQVSNVYAIDYPVEMNLASGYAIELHGTAKLVGDDRANITFKPAGASTSIEQ